MAWNDAVITNIGMSLLAQAAGGVALNICSVKCGSTSIDIAALTAQTNVSAPQKPLQITGKEITANRIKISVRVTNAGITAGYKIRQIGLFAKQAGSDNENLFAIIQDNTGETVPAESENPNFQVDFAFSIAVSNSENITVIVDPEAYVNIEDFEYHTGNKSNPHDVTKTQVGLGNVPNVTTNDQTPTFTIETANANLTSGEKLSVAFGKIAKNISSLISHLANTNNPHTVTKEQVGLGSVDNTSDNDKPISTAQQTAIDLKANASDLTGHTGNKSNPHAVTKAQVGLGSVPNVTTNDQTPTFTIGTANANLTSGEKLSVAFGKIAKNISSLISHLANTNNPHTVTKEQVGLGSVDNTSDVDKPISTAQQAAIDLKANAADLTSHTGNKSNPHSVTKTQVGLGSVPNVATNDQTPTFTIATANANLTSGEKLSIAFGKIAKAISSLISHLANKSNPHTVTKAQVGLGNVDNTSDVDKPISTAQQAAIDLKANAADLTSHTGNKSNPHSVTKTQVGLGNVDNTSDVDKPISTAQQAAIDLKANAADLISHTGNKSNPHSVSKTQVGLGSVPNVATNDQTPTFTIATANANLTSGEKLSIAFGKIAKAISSLISHLANKSNPHTVTKAQVGLGNVDNTSDVNKPISSAQQAAIDLKANAADLISHTHTKSQITDMPTALKSPAALTVKLNGTSTAVYDGSAAKSVDITPANLGAAATSHTHSYAGSSSAGGAATSAVKLQTARTINGIAFDGTASITDRTIISGTLTSSSTTTPTTASVALPAGRTKCFMIIARTDSAASDTGFNYRTGLGYGNTVSDAILINTGGDFSVMFKNTNTNMILVLQNATGLSYRYWLMFYP